MCATDSRPKTNTQRRQPRSESLRTPRDVKILLHSVFPIPMTGWYCLFVHGNPGGKGVLGTFPFGPLSMSRAESKRARCSSEPRFFFFT